MASVDDSTGNDYSKKMLASRQISKDDYPDAEEEAPAGDSFKVAPDCVLANRRMVKVRRTSGTAESAPAIANPFASTRLVPPAHVTSAETQLEVALTVDVHDDDFQQFVTEAATEPHSEAVTETVTETVTAVDSAKVSTDVVIYGETLVISTGAKVGQEDSSTVSVGPHDLSSETFQQLSSARNAFAGSFGSGFSATSITFGNSIVPSSTGLGSVTGRVSFGSSSTLGTSLFGSRSGQAAFSSFNSVFGKSNGNSKFQLFGPGTPLTLPGAGTPSSTGITLHEIHVESGEEKEKAVLAADASLFEFLDGGWKERGKGEIKVNVPEDAHRRARLVMRSKGNLRLLLNANIVPDMKITKMDNRGVTFVCANSTGDGKVGLTTYALKLRDSRIAMDFLSTVEAHKGSVTSAEPRTPESSPKAIDRLSKVSDEVNKDAEATGGGIDT